MLVWRMGTATVWHHGAALQIGGDSHAAHVHASALSVSVAETGQPVAARNEAFEFGAEVFGVLRCGIGAERETDVLGA